MMSNSEGVGGPNRVCGVVMPISAIDDCTEAHWSDVYSILSTAIKDAGFEANLVSNADDVGIIQKRIIQNLYDNPIVVCDVSGKNPNVMFELGLRLAFDKPTIIIKDNRTAYSFDTAPIEHLEYPRDLRFNQVVDFRQKLTDKIVATHHRSQSDLNYTTFLKNFGEFTVAKLDKKEVSSQEYIMEELRSIRLLIQKNDRNVQFKRRRDFVEGDLDICAKGWNNDEINKAIESAKKHPAVRAVALNQLAPDHVHLVVNIDPASDTSTGEVRRLINTHRRPLVRKPSTGESALDLDERKDGMGRVR